MATGMIMDGLYDITTGELVSNQVGAAVANRNQ